MKLLTSILSLIIIVSAAVGSEREVQMYSSYYLTSGDTLSKDLHVKIYVGDATIDGVLNGKLTLYAGNVILGSEAVVNGSIACYGGKVTDNSEEIVEKSNIHVANIKGKDLKSGMRSWISQARNYDENEKHTIEINLGYLRDHDRIFSVYDPIPKYRSTADFNRQDGFVVQLGKYRHNLGNLDQASLGLKLAYGFRSKRPQAALMFKKSFFRPDKRLSTFIEGYSELQHQDGWRINQIDNFILSLIVKEDYYDRFHTEGYHAGLSQTLFGRLRLKADYVNHNESWVGLYDSTLIDKWDPIRFKNDNFGRLAGVNYSAMLNLGRNAHKFPGMLQIGLKYENYSPDYNSDLDFRRIHTDVRYIGTFWEAFQIRTRIISAVAEGNVPDRYRYFVGGMGSLRGLPYKDYSGDRMFLATQEIGLMLDNDFIIFVFTDMGNALPRSDKNMIDDLVNYKFSDLKQTIGAGIETGDLDEFGFRIDAARDAENDKAPWVWTVRISRMF